MGLTIHLNMGPYLVRASDRKHRTIWVYSFYADLAIRVPWGPLNNARTAVIHSTSITSNIYSCCADSAAFLCSAISSYFIGSALIQKYVSLDGYWLLTKQRSLSPFFWLDIDHIESHHDNICKLNLQNNLLKQFNHIETTASIRQTMITVLK